MQEGEVTPQTASAPNHKGVSNSTLQPLRPWIPVVSALKSHFYFYNPMNREGLETLALAPTKGPQSLLIIIIPDLSPFNFFAPV